MRDVLFLLLGTILGGTVATVLLCCLQINRTRGYEAEIRRLQERREDRF